MRVFNLSDATPPYKPERRARNLKIKGVVIKPGESGDVPDTVPTSEFSGLIVSNMVSVDVVPDWYAFAKKQVELKKVDVEEELVVELPDSDEEEAMAEEDDELEPEQLEGPKRPKKRRKRS